MVFSPQSKTPILLGHRGVSRKTLNDNEMSFPTMGTGIGFGSVSREKTDHFIAIAIWPALAQ